MSLKSYLQQLFLKIKQLGVACKNASAVRQLVALWQEVKRRPIGLAIFNAFVLNLLLEILGRRSILKAFAYLTIHPFMFVMNVLIILLTMCISLFVPKKIFALLSVSFLWLTLGVINYILLGFRTTPLSAIDFEVVKTAMDVIPAYMTPWEIGLLCTAVAGVFLFLIWCWRNTAKVKSTYLVAVLFCFGILAGVGALMGLTLNTEVFATDFRNLPRAYRNYGFAYCFTASVMENGINKPMDYSQEAVESLLDRLNSEGTQEGKDQPNVIVVQLESFFDVNLLKDVEFNRNPIPNFTALKETFSHGKVTIPALGGGTANTEFELLTGMCLDFFSAGEYPYTSILQEATCESLAYNLKERGYGTYAIHNHKGTFYDRHLVYGNLGFDAFISAEHMEPLEYTPRNWEKDGVLTSQIVKCLEETDHPDFVFTVTVQPHGQYPTNRRSFIRHVMVEREETEAKEEMKKRHQLEYYINQIYETDQFLGELVETLKQRGEPTILLAYGDHLPALDLTEDHLKDGQLYQTDYVIWDNLGLQQEEKNLQCYQMSANLMSRIGFSNGLLTKYHQMCNQDSFYYDNLGILEYDMLYGQQYIYQDGGNPHQPISLRLGLADVTLTAAESWGDGTVTLRGTNFTSHSKLYINGEKQDDTVYVDSQTLTLSGKWLQPGDVLWIGQAATELIDLGTSNEFVYQP